MAFAASKSPTPSRSSSPETSVTGAECRFLIPDVTYEEYLRMLGWVGDRSIRLSFDGSNLELMSPTFDHERDKSVLGRLIEMLCYELDLEITCGGSTTIRSDLVERGLEPDECYWIGGEPAMLGRRSFDIRTDPPPNLAVEIEVSTSLLSRLSIYEELGIPEIWRRRRGKLEVLRLGDDGLYAVAPISRCFPTVPIEAMNGWMDRVHEIGERRLIKEFVAWVRAEVLPGHNPSN